MQDSGGTAGDRRMTQLLTPEAATKPVLRPVCLAAIAAAGLAAAAWIPDSEAPGLFLPLIALLAGLAVFLSGAPAPTATSLTYAGVGFVLVAMSAVRAAEWLVIPDLLLALVFAALAVADARTWPQAILGSLTPAARLPYVPAALVRSASGAMGSANPAKVMGILRGVVIGGVLVAVFWALFSSADRAFQELTKNLLPSWDLGLIPVRVFLFGFASVVTTAFALSRLSGSPTWLTGAYNLGEKRLLPWKLGRPEWITILTLLNLLFLAFTSVQVVVLFQDQDNILKTAGLTYAEYAREGFFQLLVAAALVLPVVTLAWSRSDRSGKTDELAIRILLGLLGLFTLGVVASALRRLGLYEEALGLTRSRLAAHAIALWLGALIVILLAAGAANRTRWLFHGTIGLTTIFALGFNFMNPEAMIARRNIERFEETAKIDTEYLAELSADAVPVLLELPDQLAKDALAELREELSHPEPWSSANLSRMNARALLDQ